MNLLSSSFLRVAAFPVAAFTLISLASNILVQYPVHILNLHEIFTYSAFVYPFAFLVTDFCNRFYGAQITRRLVVCGFVIAVVLSAYFATYRIAAASGTAFLLANLVDIQIFARLRHKAWWIPPLGASTISSGLDTIIFYSLAFYQIPEMSGPVELMTMTMPLWVKLAFFDYLVKLALAGFTLAPYGVVLSIWRPKRIG